MAQATISIRVDQALKKNFEGLCEDFGLSVTSAFNIFMKAVVRERKIPFEIQSQTSNEKSYSYFDNILTMRETAEKYGIQDMALEEINEEINKTRNEMNP